MIKGFLIDQLIMRTRYFGALKTAPTKNNYLITRLFSPRGPRRKPFWDLNSGFCVTCYGLLESGRDFDRGEALIAVIADHKFSNNWKYDDADKSTRWTFSFFQIWLPSVLGRFLWVRNHINRIFQSLKIGKHVFLENRNLARDGAAKPLMEGSGGAATPR